MARQGARHRLTIEFIIAGGGPRVSGALSLSRRMGEGSTLMRQIWTLIVAAAAIAGCASESDEDVAARWRHQDGSPVSGGEIAEARTACVRAGARELAPAETDWRSNPAFHPGGQGLIRHRVDDSPDSPLWRSLGHSALPIAECLQSRGLVRAP
jgi:hypothetical protein